MTLTIYASNALTSHLYRNEEFPTPQAWLGFLSSLDQELENSSNPGYSRVRLDNKMGAPVGGIAVSNVDVQFPFATQNWATVATAVGIWDLQSSGVLLQTIQLDQPISVLANFSVRFPTGQIVLGVGVVPDGYWEGGSLLSNEPDGYWEVGERAQIPDGCYEDGELIQESLVLLSHSQETLLILESEEFESPVQVTP